MTTVQPLAVEHRAAPWSTTMLGLLGVSFAYVLLRMLAFHDVIGRTPAVYPDTVDYQHVASLSLFDPAFWTYWKPWGLPLLWKLLPGATTRSAPLAQWLIASASWLLLATTVASSLRHSIARRAALCVVLAFSLTPLVAQWDGVLLSESFSASLTALLLAALLRFTRAPCLIAASGIVVIVALTSFTRDTNAYVALLVACPVGAAVAIRSARWPGIVVAAGVAVIVVLSAWSYNVNRWETPMQSVIAERILPDTKARKYFVANGMPIRPGLANQLLADRVPPDRFDGAPELAYFRPWFTQHARGKYLSYLAAFPSVSLEQPLRGFDQVITPARSLPLGLDFFRPRGFHDVLPGPITAVLYSQNAWTVITEMILAFLASIALLKLRVNTRTTIVALTGLASTVPLSIIVWNGDPLGVDRHSLVIGLLGRLGLILVTLVALDAVLNRTKTGTQVSVSQ